MSLYAKHKKTGKIVSAERINSDASWIGCQNDEWVAPEGIVENIIDLKLKGINEVKMFYRKGSLREVNEKLTIWRPCFFKENKEAILTEDRGESHEHKIAKEKIYNLLWDKNLKFVVGKDVLTIYDLPDFEDILIEERLSDNKDSKIADIMIKLKKVSEYFGRGIIIEVQLSKQNNEITDYRTWKRVEEGYNTVWLFANDFDKEGNLIDKRIVLKPFSQVKEEYQAIIDADISQRINSYGRILDTKLVKFELTANQTIADMSYKLQMLEEKLYEKAERSKEVITKIGTEIEKKKEDTLVKTKELMDLQVKNIVENRKDSIEQELSEKIREDITSYFNKSDYALNMVRRVLQEKANEFLDKEIYEKERNQLKETVTKEAETKFNNLKQELTTKISSETNEKVALLLKNIDYNHIILEKYNLTLADFLREFIKLELNKIKENK